MLGPKGYGTSANVTIVPYPRMATLTWDEAETRLFPENPVRYFATRADSGHSFAKFKVSQLRRRVL